MSIDKVLGQKTDHPAEYSPDILVREERQTNRDTVGINGNDLPFIGFDTWNAYEISGLTVNGFPVAGIAKIVYPCDSKYIVESKSIKLYFNSFNMDTFGHTPMEVLSNIAETAIYDLSELLDTNVNVVIHPASIDIATKPVFEEEEFITLEEHVGSKISGQIFNTYKESPELLKAGKSSGTVKYHSALLKSNCKVTSQPDWGDAYIHMKGDNLPTPESILEYIISFRDECHFHEEICETMYYRLWTKFNLEELCVTCLYARRGGIDINPTRSSEEFLLPSRLIDPTELHTKTTKQ